MKYNPKIVAAYFIDCGLPEPVFEHRFHDTRKWRFDVAWPSHRIAIECDGGIWIRGGHNRGAQMKKDWEKANTATMLLGWRIMRCEPKDLCTNATADFITAAMVFGPHGAPRPS